jgi:hypothetical protein
MHSSYEEGAFFMLVLLVQSWGGVLPSLAHGMSIARCGHIPHKSR